MAISASPIATTNTLEQFRTEFNILRDDVSGLEDGSVTFTEITATTLGASIVTVQEDGTIAFEGATDNAFETTLTVVDPTADRTITFPNETGTAHTSGGDTTHTNIIIGDAANIGSASDTDSLSISSAGVVNFTQRPTFAASLTIQDGGSIGSASDLNAVTISSGGVIAVTATTANTSASDGALTVAGGVGIAADLSVGDDVRLISDSVVLSFGADSDTTLTHTDGSGLTLNSTNKIMFNDASQFIHAPSATVLDLAATDEIELTATLVDVVGNFTNSGTIVSTGKITADAGIDIDNFNIDGTTIALSSGTMTLDSASDIVFDSAGNDFLFSADGVHVGNIDINGSDFIFKSIVSDKDIIFQGNDNGTGITALTLDMSAAGAATFNGNVTVGGDLDVTGSFDMSDADITNIGSISLDSITGDADANTSITFSGSDIITFATGGSTAATLNASQVLTLSGNLLIPDAGTIGSASDINAISISSGGVVAVTATTANTGASDGALTVAGGVGIAADLSVGDDLRLVSDAAIFEFGVNSDVTLTHVHDTGLLLNSSRQIQFGDSGTNISQSADGVLDLASDNIIELTGTTIDINGNVEISGTTAQVGVSTSTATDIFNAGLSVKNGATGAGFVQFFEDSDNGTNKVTLVGPASTADITLTLPIEAGTMATEGTATALAIALG